MASTRIGLKVSFPVSRGSTDRKSVVVDFHSEENWMTAVQTCERNRKASGMLKVRTSARYSPLQGWLHLREAIFKGAPVDAEQLLAWEAEQRVYLLTVVEHERFFGVKDAKNLDNRSRIEVTTLLEKMRERELCDILWVAYGDESIPTQLDKASWVAPKIMHWRP